MAIVVHLGGLPITIPDTLLDEKSGKLERKIRGMIGGIVPKDPIQRQALKAVVVVFLPKIREWVKKNGGGYPEPDPPKHCDLVAYLSDYFVNYALAMLSAMRHEIEAQPWEVQIVETRAGVQVAGFAPLDTGNPRAIAAPGDGARGGDAPGIAGATPPAA